jgi:hypothetical protein
MDHRERNREESGNQAHEADGDYRGGQAPALPNVVQIVHHDNCDEGHAEERKGSVRAHQRKAYVASHRGEENSMGDRTAEISKLLHEAAEAHHIVYRIVDGDDPDWASWYSEWLTTLSELPEILGKKPARSELTYLLVKLDKEYAESKPDEPWEDVYAKAILSHFS